MEQLFHWQTLDLLYSLYNDNTCVLIPFIPKQHISQTQVKIILGLFTPIAGNRTTWINTIFVWYLIDILYIQKGNYAKVNLSSGPNCTQHTITQVYTDKQSLLMFIGASRFYVQWLHDRQETIQFLSETSP